MDEDREFRDRVIEGLARVATEVTAVKDHLGKINGAIVKQWEIMAKLQGEVTQHPFTCEVRRQVLDIARLITKDEANAVARDDVQTAVADARAATNTRWRRIIMPIVYITTGAIVNAFAPKLAEWLKLVLK
jgi:hypothetical protein